MHGFLQLRSQEGRILASGDSVQVSHGDEVTTRTLFNFKDGSVDDETTVFSQRGALRLISDRHLQKGPSFPHPMDVLIDARMRDGTIRSTGKDGREEVGHHFSALHRSANDHLLSLKHLGSRATSIPAPLPAPSAAPHRALLERPPVRPPTPADPPSRCRPPKASDYEIKVELGGIEGLVAPLVGKAPPDIDMWITGGQAPTFVREQGPIYPEGPMMTIELASPGLARRPQTQPLTCTRSRSRSQADETRTCRNLREQSLTRSALAQSFASGLQSAGRWSAVNLP